MILTISNVDGKQATTLNRMMMLYALPLRVADAQTDSAPLVAIIRSQGTLT